MFEVKTKVNANECDYSANMSILGALAKSQNFLCDFFSEIGIDEIELKTRRNCIWVISKNKMKFFKTLYWDEKITAKVYISKITNYTINCEIAFFNLANELAFVSVVEVCIIDLTTQSIIKLKDLEIDCGNFYILVNNLLKESLIKEDFAFEKIGLIENLELVDNIIVKSYNIDFCWHTNNVEYVKFLIGTYSVENLKNYFINELQINYINQTREGDNLKVLKKKTEDCDYLNIVKDDKLCIKSYLKLKKRG